MTVRLLRPFFNRPTLDVARDLIGARLRFQGSEGIITETEAYIGRIDPACHAYQRRTARTEPLYAAPGTSYVYFIYGMYHCLNCVTEPEGEAAAVLIRGLYLPAKGLYLNGPGKLCRDLGITRSHNGIDLTQAKDFYMMDKSEKEIPILTTPRIGISRATDWPWRFVIDGKPRNIFG